MTLEVIFDNDFDVSESLVLALKNAADLTLQEEKKRDSVVNLKIVGNAEMQQLNKEFRNKDRATNVLSFTNDDLSKDVTKNIGDIAISYDFVKQEAKDHGKSFSDHVIHMLVHGIYHILGYDHEDDISAEVMESKEIYILDKLKISNPYN
jgi:probable rRNA maturation factor|tara:strand:- start:1110 stop:1559 length:450 start_codon:yes stop_codon:yes gene_type:complete